MGGFCGNADSAGLSGETTGQGGTGLRVGFNAEDTEFTEREKRGLGRVGNDHGAW